MSHYHYIGNCQTGLNYKSFCELVANDATELAQLVEDSKGISYNDFISVAKTKAKTLLTSGKGWVFGCNYKKNILWAYNKRNDCHYFYAQI